MREAPASFWALAARCHQDVPIAVGSDKGALADYLVASLDPAERRELAGFLDTVLAAPEAGVRLKGLWRRSGAQFGFARASDIGAFFVLLRGRL